MLRSIFARVIISGHCCNYVLLLLLFSGDGYRDEEKKTNDPPLPLLAILVPTSSYSYLITLFLRIYLRAESEFTFSAKSDSACYFSSELFRSFAKDLFNILYVSVGY